MLPAPPAQVLCVIDNVRSSIAGESFKVYVLVRESHAPVVTPRQRLEALFALQSPASLLLAPRLASPWSSPVKPLPPPKRSRGVSSELSSIHPAVALTTKVLSSSAVVVPGVDFVVLFTGSLSRGCVLIATNPIPAGALITEYSGTVRTGADFEKDKSLPHTHSVRLGNAWDADIIDGYELSQHVQHAIFVSGGYCLPADSPHYVTGVAVLANAPNTPSGRGGPKAGYPNAQFFFDDGRALREMMGGGGGAGGGGGSSHRRPTPRCWLVSSKHIAAGDEILARYPWKGKPAGV